jgi:hypothetical protein
VPQDLLPVHHVAISSHAVRTHHTSYIHKHKQALSHTSSSPPPPPKHTHDDMHTNTHTSMHANTHKHMLCRTFPSSWMASVTLGQRWQDAWWLEVLSCPLLLSEQLCPKSSQHVRAKDHMLSILYECLIGCVLAPFLLLYRDLWLVINLFRPILLVQHICRQGVGSLLTDVNEIQKACHFVESTSLPCL